MEHESLERLLRDKKSEGALDSHGGFTIDPKRAALKLGRSALPYREEWIVKVLQALSASSLEAPGEVAVTSSPNYILVEFPSRQGWTSSTILAFLSETDPPDRPLRHLKLALLQLAGHLKRSFAMRCQPEEIPIYWSQSGWTEEIPKRMRRCTSDAYIMVALSSPEEDSFHLARLERRRIKILEHIRNRFLWSRLQLKVDGKPYLYGRNLKSVFDFQQTSLVGPLQTSGRFEGFGLPPITGLKRLGWLELRELVQTEELKLQVMLSCHPDALNYPSRGNLKTPSRCYWLRDGVIVGEEELPLPNLRLSVTLFLGAEELMCDLSGTQLLEREKRKSLLALLPAVKAEVQNWPQESPLFPRRTARAEHKLGSGIMGACGGLLAVAFAIGVNPGLLLGLWGKGVLTGAFLTGGYLSSGATTIPLPSTDFLQDSYNELRQAWRELDLKPPGERVD